MDYLNDPIDDLLNKEPPKPKVEKTTQQILDEIIRADMEMMLKESMAKKRTLDFPDPVEPQWKN